MSPTLTRVVRRLHHHLGRYLDRCGPALTRVGLSMTAPHAGETEALATLLAGLGHQDPVESLFMLETFLKADIHLTAPIFSRLMKERGHEVGEEKAAGVLELFTSLGFAERHHTEDGRILYEPNRPGHHHDHIICSGCGRTTEFNQPAVDHLIEKIACEEDFSHLQHKLVIYGICPECRRRRHEGLPLAETKVGELVSVIGFNGPDDLKHRLGAMGLRRGARLKVLGERSGSMIVMFDCSRLALGPEMSQAVIVRAVESDHCVLNRQEHQQYCPHCPKGDALADKSGD